MSKAIVIVLLGPGERELQRFMDLIASLKFFENSLICSSTLIVINDYGPNLSLEANVLGFKHLEVIENPYFGEGMDVPIYDRLMAGIMSALRPITEMDDHDFILKLDTDAVACAPFAERIAAFFAMHPKAGMIGSFRHNPDGNPRGTEAWWAKSIVRTCGLFPTEVVRFHFKHRIPFRYLLTVKRWFKRHRLLRMALKNHWILGDNILGGAYALSPTVIEAFKSRKELFEDPKLFESTRIPDDIGLPILVAAMGFELAEFNRKGEVFGIWYQKPTFTMTRLVEDGYGFVHSIKCENASEEKEMREQIARASGMPFCV